MVPTFSGSAEDKVCYRTSARPEDVADSSLWVFEHEGPGFEKTHRSSISILVDRILLGGTVPSEMIINRCDLIDAPLATMLHRRPALALKDRVIHFSESLSRITRWGGSMIAHVPSSHRRLIDFEHRVLQPEKGLEEACTILGEWIINGTLPQPQPTKPAEIVDSENVVVAFVGTESDLARMWSEAYLIAVCEHRETGHCFVTKKSSLVSQIDTSHLARRLNEIDSTQWEATDTQVFPNSESQLDASDVFQVVIEEVG